MDENKSVACDPLRDKPNWMTPAEAAAEYKRKKSETKRIWGMVLLSGIVSLVLATTVGSIEAFFFFWFVLGMIFTSLACDEKNGPGT